VEEQKYIAIKQGKNTFDFNRLLRKIAKRHYWLRHVCLSVLPYGITVLPTDRFW